MRELRLEWDPRKAKANLQKHGVSFQEAETAFSDEMALIIDDPDHSDEEPRSVLLGLSVAARMLVVVHAYRGTNDTVRIISARRATRAERSGYFKRSRI